MTNKPLSSKSEIKNLKAWNYNSSELTVFGEETCAMLQGHLDKADSPPAIDFLISNIPPCHKLHFSCYFRKDQIENNAVITARVYDKTNTELQTWQTVSMAYPSTWSRFEAIYAMPEKAQNFCIWIQNFREDPIFVKDTCFSIGNQFQPINNIAAKSTTLLELNYHAPFEFRENQNSGTLLLPVPGLYNNQIPLTFDVSTNPRSALIGYKVFPRNDGINWLCQVEINSDYSAEINYSSIVLVPHERKFVDTDDVPINSELDPTSWLKSTSCVQSDNIEIKQKANELTNGFDSLEKKATSIMNFAASNPGVIDSEFDALDAVTGLNHGGSCMNRANLAAALLRALKIPARTIAHIPVSYSWMDQHWLTEYWNPAVGWIPLETSLSIYDRQFNQIVVLVVSSVADEMRSLDKLQQRTYLPGAPYLSTFVVSPELCNGYGSRQNFCTLLNTLEGGKSQLKECEILAKHMFQQLSESNFASFKANKNRLSLFDACQSGDASKLISALELNLNKRY